MGALPLSKAQSTDSSIYSTDSTVYLNKQRKDLCTCIYCYQTCVHASIVIYLYGISLWLTGIPGPQEKEILPLDYGF